MVEVLVIRNLLKDVDTDIWVWHYTMAAKCLRNFLL